MHSAGLELTKLTYTRLEDNLIRHRGDRYITHRSYKEWTDGGVRWLSSSSSRIVCTVG